MTLHCLTAGRWMMETAAMIALAGASGTKDSQLLGPRYGR